MTKSAKYIKAAITIQIKTKYPNFSNMKNKGKKNGFSKTYENVSETPMFNPETLNWQNKKYLEH